MPQQARPAGKNQPRARRRPERGRPPRHPPGRMMFSAPTTLSGTSAEEEDDREDHAAVRVATSTIKPLADAFLSLRATSTGIPAAAMVLTLQGHLTCRQVVDIVMADLPGRRSDRQALAPTRPTARPLATASSSSPRRSAASAGRPTQNMFAPARTPPGSSRGLPCWTRWLPAASRSSPTGSPQSKRCARADEPRPARRSCRCDDCSSAQSGRTETMGDIVVPASASIQFFQTRQQHCGTAFFAAPFPSGAQLGPPVRLDVFRQLIE
jgi:hypothetical protein